MRKAIFVRFRNQQISQAGFAILANTLEELSHFLATVVDQVSELFGRTQSRPRFAPGLLNSPVARVLMTHALMWSERERPEPCPSSERALGGRSRGPKGCTMLHARLTLPTADFQVRVVIAIRLYAGSHEGPVRETLKLHCDGHHAIPCRTITLEDLLLGYSAGSSARCFHLKHEHKVSLVQDNIKSPPAANYPAPVLCLTA